MTTGSVISKGSQNPLGGLFTFPFLPGFVNSQLTQVRVRAFQTSHYSSPPSLQMLRLLERCSARPYCPPAQLPEVVTALVLCCVSPIDTLNAQYRRVSPQLTNLQHQLMEKAVLEAF